MGNELAIQQKIESLDEQCQTLRRSSMALSNEILSLKRLITTINSDRNQLSLDVERINRLYQGALSDKRDALAITRKKRAELADEIAINKNLLETIANLNVINEDLEEKVKASDEKVKTVVKTYKRTSVSRDALLEENKELKKRKFNEDVEVEAPPLFSRRTRRKR